MREIIGIGQIEHERQERILAERKDRRAEYAAMAMQGILANPNRLANHQEAAEAAVWCADALLAELEREQ